jgi:short-subunit dehydrogenase
LTTNSLCLHLPEDREKLHGYDIDVLVNNAGIGESGSLAEIPLQKIRDNFEVNVFGTIALTQLVLQKMIPREYGTVLFVSSLGGRITMPFLSAYTMTKFALSAGADALRQEVRKITPHVHIALIEPGAYHTGFNQKNIAKQFVWMNESSFFFGIKDRIHTELERQFSILEVQSTQSVVKQIVKACEAPKPKLRYTTPWWQALGVQILRTLGK